MSKNNQFQPSMQLFVRRGQIIQVLFLDVQKNSCQCITLHDKNLRLWDYLILRFYVSPFPSHKYPILNNIFSHFCMVSQLLKIITSTHWSKLATHWQQLKKFQFTPSSGGLIGATSRPAYTPTIRRKKNSAEKIISLCSAKYYSWGEYI